MFDPALAGYWGSPDVSTATSTVVELINSHADKVAGIKVSLLDAAHEIALRSELPAGVRLYTGDDFNYPELIVGDGTHHSDALLGIFAATYPAASAAVQALDAGDSEQARKILDSTQALSRTIFAAPTRYYKTGIAFVSWLNGHQPGFTMLDGLHGARPLAHLVEVFRQTDQAGLLRDPELAAHRMRTLLAVHGWSA
jgi:dihydrodipicolinate synthase/N-acetylneuraminate lyase